MDALRDRFPGHAIISCHSATDARTGEVWIGNTHDRESFDGDYFTVVKSEDVYTLTRE